MNEEEKRLLANIERMVRDLPENIAKAVVIELERKQSLRGRNNPPSYKDICGVTPREER